MPSVLCLLVALWALAQSAGRGARAFDGHSTCARPFRGRADDGDGPWASPGRPPPRPPCDFRRQSWCTVPGSAYPWHAVRRFVQENHGLMRRMYGEQRHLSVLRAELMDSDNLVEGPDNPSPPAAPPADEDDVEARLPPATITAQPTPHADTNGTQGVRDSTETDLWDDAEDKTTTEAFTTEEGGVTSSATTGDWDAATEDSTEAAATEAGSSTSASPPAAPSPAPASAPPLPTATSVSSSVSSSKHTARPAPRPASKPVASRPASSTAASTASTPAPTQLFQDVRGKDREPVVTPQLRVRGVNACPVKEEVVAPFWANNTRGEVLALLNLYPFEQYVHWEKCTYELKQMYCREGCRCEQQYRLHRLLAYDPNNECRGIFSDWFKFPSCCVCRCYDLPMELQLTSRSPRGRAPPPPTPPRSRAAQQRKRKLKRPPPPPATPPAAAEARWYRGGLRRR